MLKIIQNNPYRFLGVCSNAPMTERLANSRKLNAFLKVNKEVSFPIDLSNLMPPLARTTEGMNSASNSINLPADQIKYALFWFINASSIDKMALEYLQNGNSAKASELFAKKEDFSSLINQGVMAFISNNEGLAIECITKVIHNETYRRAFIESVCGPTYQMSEEDMSLLFIDTLLEEFKVSQLRPLFDKFGTSSDDDDLLRERSIGEPIATINAAISVAKNVKSDDAEAQYQAGVTLMNSTKEELAAVHSILGTSDMQYQIVADNLAKQILQCGINYYNNAEEDEDVEIEKAFALQNYALSIAVGKLTKDRCEENVEILNRKKQELPPKEARYYDKFIKDALAVYMTQPDKISYAIELIKKTVPYLMSIKEVLGASNTYYLKISTLIVNVSLHNVIEEFNSVMNDRIKIQMILDREGTIRKIRNVFDQAWKATLYMDKLDMEPDFKKGRYNQNRSSLKGQVEQLIDVYQSVSLDMRGETKIFNDCRTVSDFNNYTHLFPGGKYASKVKEKLEKMEFDACKTTQDCQKFSRKYPRTKFPINDKLEECYYKQCKTLSDYKQYISSYPRGKYISQARLIIEDEEMWSKCVSTESKDMYKEYLAKFPDGRHKSEAEQKTSSCYIATMVYGDYCHPKVIVLREFRDNKLLNSSLGRSFVRFYYRNSPRWVDKMKDKKTLNTVIRILLDNFIKLYKHESK